MQLRTEHIYREFLRLTRRLSNSQIMMLLAVVVGILAGLGTYLFEILLHGIKSGLIRWFPVDSAHLLFLIYPAIGIILATLFVKYIVRDNISEGVTRVRYAMSSRNSRIPGHNCWTSIVGGATTIGFGGSVGPEAPIVLTGAAIGSNVGRLARLNYKHTTLLLCCGAGAALAAIFKAPITGVVFVLEILMLDITAGSVIPLLIASITATTMAFMLRGFDPILAVTLQPQDAFELWQIPLFILLGVCCGLMSWYIFSAMGFYPVCPGTDQYVIGAPYLPYMQVNLENGKTFTVRADKVSDKNRYIKSVTLNGQPYKKAYITHQDIMNGGELVFQMTSSPNKRRQFTAEEKPYSLVE